MNDNEKIEKEKLMDVLEAQGKLCKYGTWMPLNGICSCGYSFLDDPNVYKRCITGCPRCGWSYVE